MSIKQISIFLENKPGSLDAMTKVLAENEIDMRALSMAETTDFGIIRIIVDNTDYTTKVLDEAGYVYKLTPVIGVEIPNRAGGLNKILQIFFSNSINIEYMYAIMGGKYIRHAYMIFKVNDIENTEKLLLENKVKILHDEDISNLSDFSSNKGSLSNRLQSAIKYYEGDTQSTSQFWGDKKAYITFNSIFFKGFDSEQVRVDEGKKLNLEFAENPEGILLTMVGLMEAASPVKEEMTTYRVERYVDYLKMKEKQGTVCFTSTSTSKFLDEYRDKNGIALLKFKINKGVKAINFADLDEYKKSNECELLLIPSIKVSIKEKKIPKKYQNITDAEGKSPLVYAEIEVLPERLEAEPFRYEKEAMDIILSEVYRDGAKKCLQTLNKKKTPSDDDFRLYSTWKAAFRSLLKV